MKDLPAPLVPAEVDLRGLEYMPLFGNHLFGSEFNAAATDSEWRAALTLWWAAWNQVPAGSLPSDDIALCRLADLGRDVKSWRRLKARALHGFVECNDGRLYHAFICDQAMVAWEKRQSDRIERDNERARKERERARRQALFGQLAELGITPPWNTTMAELTRLLSESRPPDKDPPVTPRTADMDGPVTRTGTAKTGRDGTGRDGTGRDGIGIPSLLSQAPARPSAEPPPLALVEPTPKANPPDCPHAKVLALWAQELPAMPQHLPEQWKGARADRLRARWRETAIAKRWRSEADGLTYFRRLFAYVAQSEFLTGRARSQPGRRPFSIELAWLVKPENWAKTIEGKFHEEAATA